MNHLWVIMDAGNGFTVANRTDPQTPLTTTTFRTLTAALSYLLTEGGQRGLRVVQTIELANRGEPAEVVGVVLTSV